MAHCRQPARLDLMLAALHGKPLRQLELYEGPRAVEHFAADVEQLRALLRASPGLERLQMAHPGRLHAVADLLVRDAATPQHSDASLQPASLRYVRVTASGCTYEVEHATYDALVRRLPGLLPRAEFVRARPALRVN